MMSTDICRWLFLLISLSTWITITISKEMRVVCYYTNWSVYRPGVAKFTPQNINPYLCTHLIYAFGGFSKENTLKPFDKYQDIEKGGYAKFIGLKTYNKNLKTMLAIGGWNEGSSRFSPMVASSDRRKELVRNAIKFLRQNHFDGLDLDWEYPAFRDGGKPRDRDNYAQLVQELREEFDRESEKTGRTRLLLTMAVPAGIEYINKGYDVPKLMKYLDWMNILSYDYHSAFEPAVNHHAPLLPLEEANEYSFDEELNIDYTINHYIKLGAIPSKLVLGIPTYGRSYTLYNADAHEIESPADGPGTMGEYTRENGYLAYYEICEYVKNEGWEVEQINPNAMGPYAHKGNQWVGYDDENIVRRKAEYVVERGLGGIMFWAIDNDDFRGTCHGKPYPLIEAAKEAMLNAYGLSNENLISPPAKPLKPKRTRQKTTTTEKVIYVKPEKDTTVEVLVPARRRNRFRTKAKENDSKEVVKPRRTVQKQEHKPEPKSEESSTYSSLIVTPSYTTPAPPSTPDMAGGFKCEDEGFFPHPKDCKKYYWCLSGVGDNGIVAHQFTCPAGLYFNKAADSCDYSQNVLCNKKLQKASTATTTTTTTTTARPTSSTRLPTSIFATSRAPPRISTVTRPSTTTTTTTLTYTDDEYEYEDEEGDQKTGKNEEDPKVIKELIDLIKKAGGIEELERQLNLTGDASSSSGPTTQSSLSKSLYERVLSKAGRNTFTPKKNPYSFIRNSSGPQSTATEEKTVAREKGEKGKLQYTSIARNRPSTTSSPDVEAEDDDFNIEDDDTVDEENVETNSKKSNNKPNYVNIRRPRVSTTTESEIDSFFSRNKILGELSDEDDDDADFDHVPVNIEEHGEQNTQNKNTPQYVNIRRQRPSTTEGSSTSRYVEIRRPVTETSSTANRQSALEGTSSKYKTIRRNSTTPATTSSEDITSSYIGSNEKSTDTAGEIKSHTIATAAETGEITAVSANPEQHSGSTASIGNTTPFNLNNDSINDIITTEGSSSPKNIINDTTSTEATITTNSAEENSIQTKRPTLRSTTVKPVTESSSKVSQTNFKFRVRGRQEVGELQGASPKIRGGSRFNLKAAGNDDSDASPSLPSVRRRLIQTTEKIVEENRTYRPRDPELADLSSLTAVDIDQIGGLNLGGGTRKRRIRPPSTTTTEAPKISRRPVSRRSENGGSDQNTAIGLKTRGFRSRPSTSTPNVITSSTNAPSTSTKPLFTARTRKIIRRLKPITQTTTTTSTASTINKYPGFDEIALIKDADINSLFQENNVEDNIDEGFEDSSSDEEENIKLSESNIRENSDINSFIDKERKSFGKNDDFFEKAGFVAKAVRTTTQRSSIHPSTVTKKTRRLPTTTTTTEAPSTTSNRKRKVIRRLRPVIKYNRVPVVRSNVTKASTSKVDGKAFRQHLYQPDSITSEPSTSTVKINTDTNVNTQIKADTDDSVGKQAVKENERSVKYTVIRTTLVHSNETDFDKNTTERPENEIEETTTTTRSTTLAADSVPSETSDAPKSSEDPKSPSYKTFTRSRTTKETFYTFSFDSTDPEEDFDNDDDDAFGDDDHDDDLAKEFKKKEPKSKKGAKVTEMPNDILSTTPMNEIKTTTLQDSTLTSKITESYDTTTISHTSINDLYNEISEKFTEPTTYAPETTTTGNLYTAPDQDKTHPLFDIITDLTDASTSAYDTTIPLESTASTTTQKTTTTYKPRSSLTPIEARPRYNPRRLGALSIRNRLPSTTEKYVDPERFVDPLLQSTKRYTTTERSRFDKRRKIFGSRPTIPSSTEHYKSESETNPLKVNKYLVDKGITKLEDESKNEKLAEQIQKETVKDLEHAMEDMDEHEDDIDSYGHEDERFSSVTTSTTERIINKPFIPQKSSTQTPNAPIFSKTTEPTSVRDELSGIDRDAIKNRNKNLFARRRPGVIPGEEASATTEEPSSLPDYVTTESPFDGTSMPPGLDNTGSTEYLTTLHHVFAEAVDESTPMMEHKPETTTSKIERLVEVNRIVEVNTKEDKVKNRVVEEQKTNEVIPVVDKIGEVSRVTVIKVVGKDDGTANEEAAKVEVSTPNLVVPFEEIAKIEEVPGMVEPVNLTNISMKINTNGIDGGREDRKIDYYPGSIFNKYVNKDYGKDDYGFSNINIFTPRPIYHTEASTIALEGLFSKTENPSLFHNKDEVLETENSKFVNVRVLKPIEDGKRDKRIEDDKRFIPIKLLKQDEEEISVKAQIEEVKPKSGMIKIVPIRVAMSRQIVNTPFTQKHSSPPT